MQSNLVNFIQVLRSHDVRVSPAETLDAVDVAATLGYADRSLLRDGLAMTLAKTPEEEVIFLQCFERFFNRELADFSADEASANEQQEASEELADQDSGQDESNGGDAPGESALQLAAGRQPRTGIPAGKPVNAEPAAK